MIVEICPRCGADLEYLTYTTYPPIHAHICRNCGWQQEERENITRVSIATVNRKKLTNADAIRAMTDDELARLLMGIRGGCKAATFGPMTCKHYTENFTTDCQNCWLEWLKRGVEDDIQRRNV